MSHLLPFGLPRKKNREGAHRVPEAGTGSGASARGRGDGRVWGKGAADREIRVDYRLIILYQSAIRFRLKENTMAFRANGLRDAFEGQGEAAFMAWSYTSHDPLETILQCGYFNKVARLAVGDLVYVASQPRPANSPWVTQHQGQETRRALLMVRGRDANGQMVMRLVQDYGRPDDPDAEIAAARKPRGRPKARTE
jgi:hypothetical protein